MLRLVRDLRPALVSLLVRALRQPGRAERTRTARCPQSPASAAPWQPTASLVRSERTKCVRPTRVTSGAGTLTLTYQPSGVSGDTGCAAPREFPRGRQGLTLCQGPAVSPRNKTQERQGLRNSGGDGGIRTPDKGLGPYNGLANRRLQPLGHVSARGVSIVRAPAGVNRRRWRSRDRAAGQGAGARRGRSRRRSAGGRRRRRAAAKRARLASMAVGSGARDGRPGPRRRWRSR